MQTCSLCHTQSPDTARYCLNCQADLSEFSTANAALKRFRENPRVTRVYLSIAVDACPACQQMQGAYPKDKAPKLPVPGCSHSEGCRCFYEPMLDEIYP